MEGIEGDTRNNWREYRGGKGRLRRWKQLGAFGGGQLLIKILITSFGGTSFGGVVAHVEQAEQLLLKKSHPKELPPKEVNQCSPPQSGYRTSGVQ